MIIKQTKPAFWDDRRWEQLAATLPVDDFLGGFHFTGQEGRSVQQKLAKFVTAMIQVGVAKLMQVDVASVFLCPTEWTGSRDVHVTRRGKLIVLGIIGYGDLLDASLTALSIANLVCERCRVLVAERTLIEFKPTARYLKAMRLSDGEEEGFAIETELYAGLVKVRKAMTAARIKAAKGFKLAGRILNPVIE